MDKLKVKDDIVMARLLVFGFGGMNPDNKSVKKNFRLEVGD